MAIAGVPSISFLKIDVEGADFTVLRGFERSFLERRVLAVQFEHGEPSVESRTLLRDIVAFLGRVRLNVFPTVSRVSRSSRQIRISSGRLPRQELHRAVSRSNGHTAPTRCPTVREHNER